MNRLGRIFAALAWGAISAVTMITDDASAADKVPVGEGPFITGGAFYVAREKGYF